MLNLNINGQTWNFNNILYSNNNSGRKSSTYTSRDKWATPRFNHNSNKQFQNNNKNNKNIWKVFKNYLEYSTLHGLKYIGDTSISFAERFIWLISILCALACAIYFIINIYAKYSINPVIVTRNPIPVSVEDIPFPSVTICSMSLMKKSDSNLFWTNNTTKVPYQSYLDEACEFINPYISTYTTDRNIEEQDLLSFISNITRSCDQMLIMCKWIHKNIDCNRLFSPILTDMGLCCTFNQLPLEYILRNPKPMDNFYSIPYNINDQFSIDNWNPEQGYSPEATYEVFPFRSRGPGAHLGLSLVIDINVDDYYCSSSSSTGVQVALHNPAEIPLMRGTAFMLPPQLEIRAVFKPSINDATDEFKSIDIAKRRCYFTGERYLAYFNTYTTSNCLMECLSNITFQKCGCVSFYLPRNTSTKICGMKQKACSNNVRNMIEVQQTQSKEEKECNCLPDCFQLKYDKSMSYGKLIDAFEINNDILNNKSTDYFVTNMVALQLYFGTTQFNKLTKSELYRFTDMLSLIGGILGLFLGFGTLSIVEICYHLTLKWMCSKFRSKQKSQLKQAYLHETTSSQKAIITDIY